MTTTTLREHPAYRLVTDFAEAVLAIGPGYLPSTSPKEYGDIRMRSGCPVNIRLVRCAFELEHQGLNIYDVTMQIFKHEGWAK